MIKIYRCNSLILSFKIFDMYKNAKKNNLIQSFQRMNCNLNRVQMSVIKGGCCDVSDIIPPPPPPPPKKNTGNTGG